MLFSLFFYLSGAFALNISIQNQTEVQKITVSMNVESQSYIQTLDDLGKILSVKFVYGDSKPQFCTPYYQGVTIHQSPSGFVSLVHELNRKDIDELTEQDLYQGYNEKTSAYAINDEGVCILSSKGAVYFVSNQDSKDIKIKNTTLPNFNEDQQSPQIVWDEKSRNFFVVLSDSIVKLQYFNEQFTTSVVNGWMKSSNQYKVVASNGWLYSAQGQLGLLIYEIQQHGLKLTKTISVNDLYDANDNSLNIVDVAVFEDQVYLLDQIRGITVFSTYFNGTFVKNGKLGLIPFADGISFEVRGQTLILIQNFKTSSQIIELYISNSEWIEMRRVNTKSKLRKADIIDENFAIIRGLHDHKIMLIKMPESLLELDAKRLDNYFFSGNLIGVDRFGKNNETLFAISPHGFYLFNYKPYPSIIICNSNELESGYYDVKMIVKSTKCLDANQEELSYCMTNYQFNFDVKKPLLSAEQQQAYIYMAVLLASIAGALILCLIYHYRRYQVQKENINWHIEKSKKKRKDIKVES